MDLIGVTYYNLKLFLTTTYSRSINWSNETCPNCSKTLIWDCWYLI